MYKQKGLSILNELVENLTKRKSFIKKNDGNILTLSVDYCP